MKQAKQLNRVELAAAEGSKTAQNTLDAWGKASPVGLNSPVKGKDYEQSPNNGYRGKK